MSDTITIPERPAVAIVPQPTAAVQRMPLYLESLHNWLFAWLHRCEETTRIHHGVVICPPIGHEQIHAHRGLRHLADAFARAGFPTLRLDYHGTGDSAGTDEDPARCATWLANIRDAQAWMRQELGCSRITLVGLRLGATLAAQVAATLGIDGLLLWAPVIKGRAYVREMKALSLTASTGAAPVAAGSRDMEAAGFVLTEQTILDVSQLDLLKTQPRCRRALILTRGELAEDTRLLAHFKSLGIDAEQSAQPGYADMMAEPHHTRVPGEAIARAVEWLWMGESVQADRETTGQTDDQTAAGGPSSSFSRSPVSMSFPGTSSEIASIAPAIIREDILQIGPLADLFGIVSEPVGPAPSSLPVVVMLNAGASYRVGPNRLHVILSRHLAARGFRCVRLDLAGLGDSVLTDPRLENDPYPATAFRDIDITLKHLRTQFGSERFVLMGLCSGAYAAFQSAARLADPALIECVAINPLTYYWKEGMSLDISPARRIQAFRDCMAAVLKPGKWLKVLTGRSKTGIAGVMRMLVERWRMHSRARWEAARFAAPPGADAPGSPGVPLDHPSEENLPADLERIVRAGRHLACFFCRDDPGYPLLQFHARRKASALCRAGKMSVHFIEDADHTFSRREWREALGQAIGEHMSRRYKGAREG